MLSHFHPSLPTIVGTDASDYAMGAVLSQISDSGKHPIAFDSRMPLQAELNYEIHDKELLGIVWALKRWRAFLLCISSSLEALTNHSSLQYSVSSKILICCCGIPYLSGPASSTLRVKISKYQNLNGQFRISQLKGHFHNHIC
ncbi:hypothetical protein O181_122940 [Austropuccinia psidii MF-1]|uniref:Reverse transcriptase RNase H-like domain-containing protein n=1 Tax=Austropuccinia psidii MF-1 TaxID=1389203 RepID=A0A9Q3KQ79_9BASI|nr:hypothetical protein [Austropuccinia psidii MF-1]